MRDTISLHESPGAESTGHPRPVLVHPDFLPLVRCDDLIQAFRQVANVRPPGWQRSPVRVTSCRREVDGRFLAAMAPEAAAILSSVRQRAVQAVRQLYELEGELATEFTLLTEMGPSDAHPLHADNERQDADGRWVPNHTPVRDYVAMLYLNMSGVAYSGGILRFPGLGREISPRAGELVAFTCGREHQHEVTRIERGSRFSVSMWMTRDRVCAEPWD